jgi:hypothetical protein
MPATTGGASAGLGDGDFAGEPAISGGAAGFGGLLGDAGFLEAGGASVGNPAGRGGTAGDGAAGGAGGAVSGAGGTPAGAGGTPAGAGGTTAGAGTAGAGGATPTANGCAKLSVPLGSTADKAHFLVSLASTADLSGATIGMRLYVKAGSGGTIFNYVQDSASYHFLGVATAQRKTLSSFSGWTNVTWNVGAEDPGSTNIVKTSIKNIGIEISAQPSSPWTSPTVVYIDSITVTSPALSFTFDGSSSVYPTPSTTNVAGQALWLNSGSLDTTAVGATLSWQATCP